MSQSGHDPGNGVDDVNGFNSMIGRNLEHGCQPYQTEHAGTDQRHQHGRHIVADAAHGTDLYIHQGVQTVKDQQEPHPQHTGLHHVGAGGVNAQQLMPEQDAASQPSREVLSTPAAHCRVADFQDAACNCLRRNSDW